MDRFDHLIDSIMGRLTAVDSRLAEGWQGCSETDLAELQALSGCHLPEVFAALMKRIGRSRGPLMRGADFGFPQVLEFRRIADSLLSSQGGLSLDPSDFVFEMEQGYQFFFFRAGTGDDPAVLFYNDDDPRFVQVYDSLSDWVRAWIEEEIALWTATLSKTKGSHKLLAD